MSRTVLITGAAGNIGTKLRAHFSSLGWDLRLVDADNRGDAAIAVGDLSEWRDDWVSLFAGVDVVVHLAGDPRAGASWASVQRLNIDLTQNVYEASVRLGVRRLIFASSNWVMAGYRTAEGKLTTDMAPFPVNPYGASKLFGERMGRSYCERWGLSVVCFRIGYCQKGENIPGPHMGWGAWGQLMWLSNRDLCQAMERAVVSGPAGFAVLNLMSENPGMRWDIETTKRAIGYAPQDGAAAVEAGSIAADEHVAELIRGVPGRP